MLQTSEGAEMAVKPAEATEGQMADKYGSEGQSCG